MEKDMIFFGDNGLTSTSANFISNICKESYAEIEKELESVKFTTTTVKLIGSTDETVVSRGIEDVSKIKENIMKVAQLKSLIAWLREAIKARERLFKEALNMDYEDFGIEVPIRPESAEYITDDDVIASWNIKQRNRYYYLDTLCAQIGQYIHPNGAFSKARKSLLNVMNEPYKVVGDGRDTLVYSYIPTIPSKDVEDEFMSLQQQYRSYQAELNSMKHSIETAVMEDKNRKDSEYAKAYQEYSSKLRECQNLLELKRNGLQKEIQELKIVIPDSLKPIYEEVSTLGKK